jgi:SAM-dependent methyltransferase
MARHVRLAELLVGIEGLALLRHLYDSSDAQAEARLQEVARIVADQALVSGEAVAEAEPRAGYAAWSDTYDDPGNPVVAIEEPAVRAVLDRRPPGRVLDAACGTGRHGEYLARSGHEIVGVDCTHEMLVRARSRPGRPVLAEGDLRALPFVDGRFDLVVCGLALAHIAALDGAVAELARVLAPGGHLVVSVLHPFLAQLGWHAPFEDAAGRRGFVREHGHSHSDYLSAFRRAGLRVRDCIEPELTVDQLRAKRRAWHQIPVATVAAYERLPGVLIWDADRE